MEVEVGVFRIGRGPAILVYPAVLTEEEEFYLGLVHNVVLIPLEPIVEPAELVCLEVEQGIGTEIQSAELGVVIVGVRVGSSVAPVADDEFGVLLGEIASLFHQPAMIGYLPSQKLI